MFVFLFIVILFTSVPVYGARITIETETTTGTVGTGGVPVKAKLLNADSPDSGNSHRENAEIKVRDGRDGDKCDTIGGGSDVNGYIYGTCYATSTGSYNVFVHSERGDDSPEVTLTFNEAPAPGKPTDIPVSGTQNNPVKKKVPDSAARQIQKQGAAQNPFMQDGLVPEQPVQDTGLATGDQQVMGTVDTTELEKGAPDLLKSLIFLTGALVLLIWSGYLIYLQLKGKRGKKDQHPGIPQKPGQSDR